MQFVSDAVCEREALWRLLDAATSRRLDLPLLPWRKGPGVSTFWIGQPEGLPEGSYTEVAGGHGGGDGGGGGGRPRGRGEEEPPPPGGGASPATVEPARDWRCPRELSWHPSAVRTSRQVTQSEGPCRRQVVASVMSPRCWHPSWRMALT